MTIGLGVALISVGICMFSLYCLYLRFFHHCRWELLTRRHKKVDWDAEYVRQFGHDERKEDR